jgi:hypothetical protein
MARSVLNPASTDRSAAPGSNAGSITLASATSDFHDSFGDDELDAYFAEEDHGESFGHVNVFMALGNEDGNAPDPFTTPLPANATAEQVEQHCVALEDQKKKEVEERKKFRLEQFAVANVSCYRTTHITQRLQGGTTTHVLDFGPNANPQQEAEPGQRRNATP